MLAFDLFDDQARPTGVVFVNVNVRECDVMVKVVKVLICFHTDPPTHTHLLSVHFIVRSV